MLAHPNDVSRDDIEAEVAKQERRIASHHLVDGLIFPIRIDPSRPTPRINAVADVGLFNGIRLMGLVAKYGVTSDPGVLREIGASIDALYKLTHITGTPGLLTRYALPLERAIDSDVIPASSETGSERTSYRHIYYRDPGNIRRECAHLRNIVAGRDGMDPISRSPAGRLLTGDVHYEDQYFCTRTSRDQLTGVVFGIAFAMKCFEAERGSGDDRGLIHAIRRTVSRTVVDLYGYLREHRFRMIDPVTGSGARANDVSGVLRTVVELLFRRALMNQWTESSWRDETGPSLERQLEWFRQDTRGACLPLGIDPQPARLRATWWWTRKSYAWHLRLLRLVSVLVLDDLHAMRLSDPLPGWPRDTLTRSATTARNRAWLRVFDKAYWKRVGAWSDPWATYLFNRMRADVLMRHMDGPMAARVLDDDQDIYAMARVDFDRLAEAGMVHMPGPLRDILFDGFPTVGSELPRAHFHLRSLALKPWRCHSAPWGAMKRGDRRKLQTLYSTPVYPPHLMKFTTNFLFEKDPTRISPATEDPVGRSERMLIDLPVLYWTIVEDGQWRSQWTAFPSSAFTPPAEALTPTHRRQRATPSRLERTDVAANLS